VRLDHLRLCPELGAAVASQPRNRVYTAGGQNPFSECVDFARLALARMRVTTTTTYTWSLGLLGWMFRGYIYGIFPGCRWIV